MERDVVSIVWHRSGHHIWLTFIEGDVNHFIGAESYATDLAQMAGLDLKSRDERTMQWVRDEGSWHREMPMSS